MREEIPQRAFINAQIIMNVERGGDWQSAINAVCEEYGGQGLVDYQFKPAYVVSLLYCLLVVPKEIWIGRHVNPTHPMHPVIDKIGNNPAARATISAFTIISNLYPPSANDVYNLLHRLRNSIAHANYTIDNELNFEFWNEADNGTENFRAAINGDKLMRFLEIVGAELANWRVNM